MSKEEFKAWQTVGCTPAFPTSTKEEDGFLFRYFDNHIDYPENKMDELLPWGDLLFVFSNLIDVEAPKDERLYRYKEASNEP